MVYRGDDGQLWCSEATEFDDGRFERLAGPVQGVGMEPLGEVFEAVWDANIDQLYDSEPVQQAGGDQVGRVARALCVQGGYDPDERP